MPAALATKPEPQTRREGPTRRTSAVLTRNPGPFLTRVLRWFSLAFVLAALVLSGRPASAYTYAVVNLTPFPIYASLDYVACPSDNKQRIEPGKERVFRSGGCLIKGVTTWTSSSWTQRSN